MKFGKLFSIILLCGAYAAFAWVYTSTNHISFAKTSLADTKSLSLLLRGQKLSKPMYEPTAVFHNSAIPAPYIPEWNDDFKTLSISVPVEKRIEVDLTNQKVYAYEGSRLVYTFIVSTGLWGWTPTGEFSIWTKVRSQLMQGGDKTKGTYYYLPNVPYVMFFYNDTIEKMRGFSFHGAYWHNNFGHPMSHGCINMRNEDAKLLYEWATPVVTNPKAWSTPATPTNPGTKVIIYGETPVE